MANKIGLGGIVKNVAGGFVSNTIARLTGAGLATTSVLKDTKAKWSGRNDRKDWRVKLTLPVNSDLQNTFFPRSATTSPGLNYHIMAPLKDVGGIVFPLTPSMIIQHSANYNALAQTHSNYPFQAYQNSQVDQMNIIGDFPVQNSEDAKYWIATVNFLRTVTKMFFGGEQDFKGNPPPVLHLSGYGDHMFDKVPVIVQSMNVELRAGVDYISTKQGPFKQPETNINIDDLNSGESQTWAPTLSTVSCGVVPVYSRDSVKAFSLQDFASGKLNKGQQIGFI